METIIRALLAVGLAASVLIAGVAEATPQDTPKSCKRAVAHGRDAVRAAPGAMTILILKIVSDDVEAIAEPSEVIGDYVADRTVFSRASAKCLKAKAPRSCARAIVALGWLVDRWNSAHELILEAADAYWAGDYAASDAAIAWAEQLLGDDTETSAHLRDARRPIRRCLKS